MKNLLGIKNINCHSELTRKSVELAKPDFLFLLGDSESINLIDNKELALIDSGSESGMTRGRGKCIITPPEFLSSQSSLRNSILPVQGGRINKNHPLPPAGTSPIKGADKAFKKVGFTLAEVLITLGIIGVVAAMTIPNLMTRLEAIKLQSQYKEAYSTLAQAVKMYNADEERGDGSMYRSLMKYFTGVTDCGGTGDVVDDSTECFIRQSNVDGNAGTVTNRDAAYKTYSKKVSPIRTNLLDDGQFYLQKSGMLVAFDSNYDNPYISVDINGKHSKPNAWGHDLFTFELVESEKEGGYELLPMGALGTAYYGSREAYCSKTDSSNNINGITCAYYAQSDSSYFKNLP